jgi:uncharacterized repeat protein (TIGR01451 family)/uncharacterized protein (TIGR03382 family)
MDKNPPVHPPSPRAAGAPRLASRFPLLALLATCWGLVTACGEALPEKSSLPHQEFALPGSDGELIVNDDQVLNRYAVLAADASAGATSLQVTAAADLDDPSFGALGSGDLVFIIQMQGASIDTTQGPSYGAITNLNGAGLHEFAVVRRVEGNTLHLACAGLRNSYSVAGRTQVVRVPQLSNLTLQSGAIQARPWDGQRGGVVVLHVSGTTTIDSSGSIDASGRGFRAGARENMSAGPSTRVTLYRSVDAAEGAEKGESIVGDGAAYDTLGGRYGRGAPANGGGGGNSHNAGGGGGSNGNSGQGWSGQGVMSGTVVGAPAWQLDPGYIANGNARTSSSGGGRGGYTFSSTNQDALTVGPGNAVWAGNSREEVGGLGGRPLDNDVASRLFLGGGGGAGDGNNNAGAAGGNGGGLVYLVSSTVGGAGRLLANGGDAENTTGTHNDAPGGGGGGGTIVVLSDNLFGITLEARGGRGGNQLITVAEAEGPGGGGGGGFVAMRGGEVPTFVSGGQSGTTISSSLTEFPVNGATFGAAGQSVNAPEVDQPWLTCAPIDLAVTITNGQTTSTPGTRVPYTVVVTNAGPGTVTNARVFVPIPASGTGATWTCSAPVGSFCQSASGVGGIATSVTLPPGGRATFTFRLDVSPSATGTLSVTATAAEPVPGLEINPANNTATDSDTLEGQAELSVTLSDSADPSPQGDPLTYTVQVFNEGPSDASNITVSFPIPVDSIFSSASGPGWTCAEAANVVTCTRPSLPLGGAPDISITVVPTIDGGTLEAEVTVDAETLDPTGENNRAFETTTIIDTNNPPVNTVPGAQSTPEDTPLVFGTAQNNAISVADTDAGAAPVQVVLTVTQGTLTLGGTTGLTFTAGDGTSDTAMTFTGTLTAINAALQGLRFAPDANYNGGAVLTITSNDQGNTGPGGPKSDTDTVAITITPVNDPPVAVDDTATVPAFSTAAPIEVLANDSTAPDSGETLIVTAVTQGSQGGTVTIEDGGARVTYTPAPGFQDGTETFTYTVSDGNGGTSTATVTVTVGKAIERRVVGSGCSTSGSDGVSSAVAMLLALLVLLRRGRRAAPAPVERHPRALATLGAVAVLAASSSAWAQGTSAAIDVQQFRPAPGRADVLGLHSPSVQGDMNWRAGLYVNYAHEPLVIINPSTEALLQHLVRNQLGFDLMGAFGWGERFELGLVAPLNLQRGEFIEVSTGNLQQSWKGGLGDLRLIPKVLLLDGEDWRLGLAAPVVLPTGGAADLRGQEGIGVQPHLAAEYAFEGGTRVLANVGANLRSRQELLNLSVGNELTYGLGAAIPFQLREHPFTGLASVGGAFGLGATGGTDEEEVPLEAQAGLQTRLGRHLLATLGVGRGLTLGYGMPVFRVFTGVSWVNEAEPRARPKDSDGDGLANPQDGCPQEPEDNDGFQDQDGCADLDNDQDGVPDVADKCPLEPEDKDGFQDEDGCPDPDNDQDGIVDAQDKCPLEAEDKDGFQDEDGCPEPDNDEDGIVDAQDKCSLKPEDKDAFQDEDGCPDPDNDRDGIEDGEDQCPQEQEVINSVEDTDGCPDVGETKVEVTANKIRILEKVYFATNKDVVLARSFPLLQQVALVLRANPEITKVRVEGHTDDRAGDDFNLDLSRRRAANVRKYLVEQAGIAPERLESEGYGETRPVDTNKTEAGRENNRRVEFVILEFNGEPQAP